MPTVTFQRPADEGGVATIECSSGESVFLVGQRADVRIETACVGKGTCGLCRVRIRDGEHHLSEYSEIEEKHLGNLYHLTKLRLACQAVVTGGDVIVEPAPKRRSAKTKR